MEFHSVFFLNEQNVLKSDARWLEFSSRPIPTPGLNHCERFLSSQIADCLVRILCKNLVKETREKQGKLHWPPRYTVGNGVQFQINKRIAENLQRLWPSSLPAYSYATFFPAKKEGRKHVLRNILTFIVS